MIKFSQDNDIIFNSLKSVYVVFRPKRYQLFCPPVYLHEEKLCRIHETKYLEYFLSEEQSDDAEIYKQIRNLYIRPNKLLRMFICWAINVKKDYLEVIVHLCIVVLNGLIIIEKQLIEN